MDTDNLPPLLPPNNEPNLEIAQENTYYRTVSDDLEFQLLYRKTGDRKSTFIIDKSGKECAAIYVDEDETNITRELLLSKVIFKPSCRIGSPMTRGRHTITMLKLLLCFTMKMIPKYTYVVLTDDSHIDCILPDSDETIEIPLSYFSFIQNGKTWYQMHFGATLDELDIERTRQLTQSVELLNEPVTDIAFETFWQTFFPRSDRLRRISWYNSAKNRIKSYYENNESRRSWIELFKFIFGRKDDNIGCTLFGIALPVIKTKFKIPELYQTHWKISRETIEAYPEYTIDHALNVAPVHIKKSETDMKLLFGNNIPFFTVGGSRTRNNRIKHRKLKKGYGGIIAYLAQKEPPVRNRKTKRNRKRS